MALDPKDIPITREQVAGWLNIYSQADPTVVGSLKDFLLKRITAAKLGEETIMVDTTGHDNLNEATPLVDMILMDLESYGYGHLG